jgi:hypothetical protein
VTKVQKWGNSQGLRLPKHVLESIDYLTRKAKFIEKASDDLVADALDVLDVCIKQRAGILRPHAPGSARVTLLPFPCDREQNAKAERGCIPQSEVRTVLKERYEWKSNPRE